MRGNEGENGGNEVEGGGRGLEEVDMARKMNWAKETTANRPRQLEM